MREEPPALTSPPAVQVFVLGGFRVVVHGEALDDRRWRRKTARQLFKALLSRRGRRMTRDEVIDLLWPDSDPDAASSNLRSTLHAMRHAVEAAAHTAGLGIVFADRDSVWLRTDVELWVDADAFERTVDQARQSTDPFALYEQASALYAGDYLPDDLYEDWATERRDALKRTWTEVQFGLVHQAETHPHADADADAAARPLLRLIQADPCNERAVQELMRLYARHGRRSDALRTYQHLVVSLREELDVEPSDDSTELYRQISAGEASPPPPGSAASFRCAYPFPAPIELIGREAELAVLSRVLSNGRTAGQSALVGAPAGTGKSALLGQIVGQAQSQNVLCLAGGCYEERGAVPLGPFHDALVDYLLAQPAERVRSELGASANDLARVVPELRYQLNLSDVPSRESPQADRMRVFGAIHAWLRSLAERGPTLLCVEDLHAADEATLQLFHYLARQTRRLPLVLIGTFRSDEAPPEQPLAQMLAAVTRERLAEHVRLAPLGRPGTTRLIGSLLDGSASEPLSDSVYTSTGGNPLFVEQLLLALSEGGQLQQRAGVWHGTTDIKGAPPIVGEVIAQRLQRLTASCRDTLATAAVLGQTVEHDLLLSAVEPLDEKGLLADLDQAITASVLQETTNGYAFRHSLLRDTVYWSLNGPRRMLLHARSGELLERLHGAQADDHAAELAYHFTLAGHAAPVRAKALHYGLLAGRQAAQLASYPAALDHFGHAWHLIDADGGLADLETRLDVLRGRAFAEAQTARWLESVASYRQALSLSQDPMQRARARGVMAFSLGHIGYIAELLEECNAGLAELNGVEGAEATGLRVHLRHLIALAWTNQGHFSDVVRLGHLMEREAATVGPGPRMLAHLVIGWGLGGMGQVEQAIAQYQLALIEAEERGDKVLLATVYENLGKQDYLGGRFSEAHEHLGRALTIFHESANELRAVNALHNLCRVWVAEGDCVRASEQIAQALDLELQGEERWAADAYHILGAIQTLHAEWESARSSFEQAIQLRKRPGHSSGTVEALVALGRVDQYVGQWTDAANRYMEAVRIADEMDPSPQQILAYRSLGRLHLLAGEAAVAAEYIENAFELAQTMPETLEYAAALLAMAELRANSGEQDQALELALQSLDRAGPLEQQFEAHAVLARLLLDAGNSEAANQHATAALDIASRLDSPRLLSQAHFSTAVTAATMDANGATSAFEAALLSAEDARAPYERAIALSGYARYLRAIGARLELASSLETEASALVQGLRVTSYERLVST